MAVRSIRWCYNRKMFNTLRRIPYLCGLVPFTFTDVVEKTNITAKSFEIEKLEDETGQQRLYMMFSVDEYGSLSPELNSVIQASSLGALAGIIYGGFIRSRLSYVDFMERNDATQFTSHFEAKKKLQNTVTIGFAKGAFQWGWRIALFSGAYVLISTTISVYRGQSSLLEYITAGFLTGGLYKVNMGLRGMIVGSLVGTAFGSVAGCASLALLMITGMTMEEMRYWQYSWKQNRDAHVRAAIKKQGSEDHELIKYHDRIVEERLKGKEESAK